MLAENICIRLAQPQDSHGIAMVHVESWKTTYHQLLPPDFLNRLSVQKRKEQWLKTFSNPDNGTFIYVAETQENKVVGFICGGKEREQHPTYTGEIYAIYLLAAYQQQGIGRKLMRAGVQDLLKQGHHTMLIWVAEGNSACHFYAVLGGVPLATRQVPIGETLIRETSYGWSNLKQAFL